MELQLGRRRIRSNTGGSKGRQPLPVNGKEERGRLLTQEDRGALKAEREKKQGLGLGGNSCAVAQGIEQECLPFRSRA